MGQSGDKLSIFLILIFLMVFFLGMQLAGQEKTKIMTVEPTGNPPKIDGRLKDECWQGMEPISGFFQFDPVNGVKASEETFNGITYNTHIHYQVTRKLFLSTRLLGETRDDQYNLDLLVGYYFGAGNVVQLSFKKGRHIEDDEMEKGYSITLKVSYLLRI